MLSDVKSTPLIRTNSVPHLRKAIFSHHAGDDQQNCWLASFPLEYFGRSPFKNKPSRFLSSLECSFLKYTREVRCVNVLMVCGLIVYCFMSLFQSFVVFGFKVYILTASLTYFNHNLFLFTDVNKNNLQF